MKTLSLVLASLFTLPFASAADPIAIGHMDGHRKSCTELYDSAGTATGYRITDPSFVFDGEDVIVRARFEFLRCVEKNIGEFGWAPQALDNPVNYVMSGHDVSVQYREPEILLLDRNDTVLASYALDEDSSRAYAEFRVSRAAVRSGNILEFALFLRLSYSYSADGAPHVEMGRVMWGGYTIRGSEK